MAMTIIKQLEKQVADLRAEVQELRRQLLELALRPTVAPQPIFVPQPAPAPQPFPWTPTIICDDPYTSPTTITGGNIAGIHPNAIRMVQ
jgi:hypothetical protein